MHIASENNAFVAICWAKKIISFKSTLIDLTLSFTSIVEIVDSTIKYNFNTVLIDISSKWAYRTRMSSCDTVVKLTKRFFFYHSSIICWKSGSFCFYWSINLHRIRNQWLVFVIFYNFCTLLTYITHILKIICLIGQIYPSLA